MGMERRRPRRCSPATLSLRPGDLGMERVRSKQSRDGCVMAERGHGSLAMSRVLLGVPPASALPRTAASVPEGASR
jgi:hypothetical protein